MNEVPKRGQRLLLEGGLVTVENATATDTGVDLIVRRPSGELVDRAISWEKLAAAAVPENDGRGRAPQALAGLWGRWMQYASPRLRTAALATRSGVGTTADKDIGIETSGADTVKAKPDVAVDDTKPDSYSWYGVELANRSLTDEARRDAIRAHLIWLASKLDEPKLDHQLITLKYELMAGTDANMASDFKARAQLIQASKVDVEEES